MGFITEFFFFDFFFEFQVGRQLEWVRPGLRRE